MSANTNTDTTTSAMDLTTELDTTGYSIGHVMGLLNKYNEDYLKAKGSLNVKNITAADISVVKGVMSKVFVSKVTFNDDSEYKFVMKIPTLDQIDQMLSSFPHLTKVEKQSFLTSIIPAHNNECDTITFLNKVPNFPTATIYYIQKSHTDEPCGLDGKTAPGVIMMSVLTGICPNYFSSTNLEQLKNIVECLASLHSYVDNIDKEDWDKVGYLDYHFIDLLSSEIKRYVLKLKERYPELVNTLDQIMGLDPLKFSKYALQERPKALNAFTVMLGDFQANNIMFDKNQDDSISNTVNAFFDFQLSAQGSPMFDLARYAIGNVDTDLRQNNIKEVITHYYTNLTELSEKNGKQPTYSLEDCFEMYELCFIHQTYQNLSTQAIFDASLFFKQPTYANKLIVSQQKFYNCLKDCGEIISKREKQLEHLKLS